MHANNADNATKSSQNSCTSRWWPIVVGARTETRCNTFVVISVVIANRMQQTARRIVRVGRENCFEFATRKKLVRNQKMFTCCNSLQNVEIRSSSCQIDVTFISTERLFTDEGKKFCCSKFFSEVSKIGLHHDNFPQSSKMQILKKFSPAARRAAGCNYLIPVAHRH